MSGQDENLEAVAEDHEGSVEDDLGDGGESRDGWIEPDINP